MQIELSEIGFTLPEGFEDQSNYTFADEPEEEILKVSFDESAGADATVATLMADRRSQLGSVFGDQLKIEAERALTVGTRPASLLVFSYESEGKAFCERWVVLDCGNHQFCLVAYKSPGSNRSAEAAFQRILDSLRVGEPPAETKPPRQFIRRRAGPVLLEVPAQLKPPETYVFVLARKRVRLEIGVYGRGAQNPPRSIDEELAQERQRGGEILDERAQAVLEGRGNLWSYLLVEKDLLGPRRSAIRRARILLENGMAVHVVGRAPEAAAAELDSAVSTMIRTLHRAKSGRSEQRSS